MQACKHASVENLNPNLPICQTADFPTCQSADLPKCRPVEELGTPHLFWLGRSLALQCHIGFLQSHKFWTKLPKIIAIKGYYCGVDIANGTRFSVYYETMNCVAFSTALFPLVICLNIV